MLWPDPRIVEPRRDREPFEDLAIVVLQQIRAVAVQNTGASAGQRGAVFHLGVHAFATSLDADDVDGFVVKEWEKQTHGV